MHPFWQSIFGSKLPSVYFCEEATSQFIARPGYFVSNIPYILLGIYLLLIPKNQSAKLIGISSILVGTFSSIYDASYTFYANILDLMGMLILINILFYISLKNIIKNNKLLISILTINQILYLVLALVIQARIGQIWFAVNILFYIIIESIILIKKRNNLNSKYFIIGLLTFLIGVAFWIPDGLHLYCFPSDWLQGRGIFHYITTIAIYLIYRYYISNKSYGNEKFTKKLE